MRGGETQEGKEKQEFREETRGTGSGRVERGGKGRRGRGKERKREREREGESEGEKGKREGVRGKA